MSENNISIIIPVYNAASFIAKTVESCLQQSLQPAEIILINDGSTDDSLQLIQDFAAKHSHIKIYDQENAGPSVTRNRGVELANNDWVCFLDADDLFHPQRLQLAADFIDDATDAIICEFSRFQENETPLMTSIKKEYIQTTSGLDAQKAVLRFGYGLPRMLMRRSVYLNSGGLDESLVNNEDHELHFRMLTQGVRFKKINVPLYYYRQHNSESRLSNQSSKLNYIYQALDKQVDQIPLLPQNLQSIAKENLTNRIASNALKQARSGDEDYKIHLEKALKLNPHLKPYQKDWMNLVSKILGYGNIEKLAGKFLK